MSKFLGFLLGVAVALAGPAVFGVLAAPGGIELNAKGMALAFGIGALVFWAVVSYFSGAGALGAFVAFGTLVYCWLWIPNRTTNFLNDVPGVTNGMIDGTKQYTLNGVVPILGVISLVYAVQLIVRGVQRRRRERVEAERVQREQEAAQAQQEADVAAVYPIAGGTYQAPAAYQSHSSYDDLFDEPEPVQPRNQADEQTRQFSVGGDEEFDHTRPFPAPGAESNYSEDTVATPAPVAAEQEERQEQPVQQEPVAEKPAAPVQEPAAPVDEPAAKQEPAASMEEPTAPVEEPVAAVEEPAAKQESVAATEPVVEEPEEEPVAPVAKEEPVAAPAPVVAEQEAVVEEPTVPVAKQEAVVEPEETKPIETKPIETKPDETRPSKAEAVEGPKVSPKEQVGSQYRERMEDPEDTGEFFLAFENPAVKPA
ncbi:hypothetical protein [Kribbella sp. NPDC004536]|uniref:hypothetical protein n=1 Tax=Kribbella sp. NPDC004536 TaxID=3364106 RepID=UPI0036CEA0A7